MGPPARRQPRRPPPMSRKPWQRQQQQPRRPPPMSRKPWQRRQQQPRRPPGRRQPRRPPPPSRKPLHPCPCADAGHGGSQSRRLRRVPTKMRISRRAEHGMGSQEGLQGGSSSSQEGLQRGGSQEGFRLRQESHGNGNSSSQEGLQGGGSQEGLRLRQESRYIRVLAQTQDMGEVRGVGCWKYLCRSYQAEADSAKMS